MWQLFSFFRSSAAYRVRIALNYKGIKYDQIPVNLLANEQNSEKYLRINSQGLIPSLQLDDGTVITQSTSILEWLEEQHSDRPLYPVDSIERSKARALVNTIACDIHPLNNLRVLRYLKSNLGVSEEQRANWYRHWIEMGFESLEGQINSAPFALGNEVSMVDVYLVPQVYNSLQSDINMSLYPKIMSCYSVCNELDSFKAAMPSVQPDAK